MNRLKNVFAEIAKSRTTTTVQQETLHLTTDQTNLLLLQKVSNTLYLIEEQRLNLRLSPNLVGVDMIRQAHERGCGRLHHILLMIAFILSNWRKASCLL
ncbi:unnamed protein product [Rotaria magnacalcarata]|uniref:Uncharacterized protein n=1 Tax=Rotaria magnacalcarata TaxID=392030 RepID=A0A816S4U1_9BILA|nr:unnamed protein product [Rotaria magnacalcarata]CAF5218538.1 unnamed protein product [Rotaria magnacalcarata]